MQFHCSTSLRVEYNSSRLSTSGYGSAGTLSLSVGYDLQRAVGTGTFQAQVSIAGGNNLWSVTSGDFNKDGNADLAVADATNGNIRIELGNGDGTFRFNGSLGTPALIRSVETGDFNGDGKLDLVTLRNASGLYL